VFGVIFHVELGFDAVLTEGFDDFIIGQEKLLEIKAFFTDLECVALDHRVGVFARHACLGQGEQHALGHH